LIDLALSLRAIKKASDKTRFRGLLMLQKIMFVAGYRYRASRERVLGQSFYRWDYGPMSDEVYEDFTTMGNLGLISGAKDEEITLTPEAESVLTRLSPLFEENLGELSELDEVADQVKNLDSLMKYVYSMKVRVEELDRTMPMDEIPKGYELLSPLFDDEAEKKFKFDDAWLETFELMLDRKADREIKQAIDDARNGRVKPLVIDR
jgi:uncharacterized protein YwgA